MKRIELSGIFIGDSWPDPFMGIRSGQVEVGRPKIQSEIISIRIQFSNRSTSTWPDCIPKKGSNSYARKLNFTREKSPQHNLHHNHSTSCLTTKIVLCITNETTSRWKASLTIPMSPPARVRFSTLLRDYAHQNNMSARQNILFAILAEETPIPEKRQHFWRQRFIAISLFLAQSNMRLALGFTYFHPYDRSE